MGRKGVSAGLGYKGKAQLIGQFRPGPAGPQLIEAGGRCDALAVGQNEAAVLGIDIHTGEVLLFHL